MDNIFRFYPLIMMSNSFIGLYERFYIINYWNEIIKRKNKANRVAVNNFSLFSPLNYQIRL